MLPLALQRHGAASDPAAVGLMIAVAALRRRGKPRRSFPHGLSASCGRRPPFPITLDAAIAAARELASSRNARKASSDEPATSSRNHARAAGARSPSRRSWPGRRPDHGRRRDRRTVMRDDRACGAPGRNRRRARSGDARLPAHRSERSRSRCIARTAARSCPERSSRSVSGPARGHSHGGTDGAQFPLPSQRHRHRDGIGGRRRFAGTRRRSSARARRRPAARASRNMRCAPVAAPTTASASTTPS